VIRLRFLVPFLAAAIPIASSFAAQGAEAAGPNAGPALAVSASASPESQDPRRGLVIVEREGKPTAFGVVLASDGRVLTALSSLGGAELAEVRFADGTVARAKLGHKDVAWDLALLVPQSGKWSDGLRASGADPAATEIRTFAPGRPKPQVVVARVKGRFDASPLKKDESGLEGGFPNPLQAALDVDVSGPTPVVGAPIVDKEGTVLGVLVRACRPAVAAAPSKDGGPVACTPGVVGAPVSALRAFLLRTPAAAAPPAPFLGIVGASDTDGPMKGVKVMAVAPGGPAEKALKPQSDVIVAVDGLPVDTPEKVGEAIARHAVGESVKLLVFAEGKIREVAITLRAAP